MYSTKLIYLEDMQQLTCSAQIVSIEKRDDGKTVVYLDQTVFYPQGGGQPFDTGTINATGLEFAVEEVRFLDGQVLHIGTHKTGSCKVGDTVTCTVDENRRKLNTRLHSAGHIVDMAVDQLGYTWIPSKGYHFPQGSYVEYRGSLGDETADAVAAKLTRTMRDLVASGIKTTIKFVTKEDLATLCRHVPEYLPKDKPSRVVLYGDFGVPCGGTHVAKLQDVGEVTIRKVKAKDDTLRVSYEIA